MQISKTKPKNTAFFNRYAELITSLSSVATLAQIITGACEIGILYSLLFPSFVDVVPARFLNTVSILCAVLCASMLQIGLKKVFPYSVRAVLFSHFKGLDLALSIGIFILKASLLTASVYLSFNGSKEIAEFAVSKPIDKTTDKADSLKSIEFLNAQRLFTSDSATIETKYKGKTEAIQSEYGNTIATIERTGKHATTLRSELKTKLGNMDADKATELEAKAAERKKLNDHATARADGEALTIATDNGTAKSDAEKKKSRYKGYIGYLTLVCYVFFLSVFAMNEIYHKGADIKTKPIPSQRHFNASLIAELLETLKEKFDVFFRTKLYAWHDRTSAQPLPNALRALYEHEADVLTDTVKVESTAKETKVIKIPMKVHKVAASTEKDTSTDKEQRQPIGFKNNSNGLTANAETITASLTASVANSILTASVGNEKTRNCLHCGAAYVYSIHNQKYCSESHRIAAYEQRSGKALLKKKSK